MKKNEAGILPSAACTTRNIRKKICKYSIVCLFIAILAFTMPNTSFAAQTGIAQESSYVAGQVMSLKVSSSNKNALALAKSYLDIMPFSKSGLIDQLEYEGFSHKQAKYAVNHCGANWNKQAVKMAKSYLKSMPFSKSGLIDQLEYEGFTTAQAKYGVKKCGANWNKQAVKMAKSYLKIMSFSKSGLIEQLEYEGFTAAQAEYAVNKVY